MICRLPSQQITDLYKVLESLGLNLGDFRSWDKEEIKMLFKNAKVVAVQHTAHVDKHTYIVSLASFYPYPLDENKTFEEVEHYLTDNLNEVYSVLNE